MKTEAQQAVLAMHRMRQQLIMFRTMHMNGLRGFLTRCGEVMAKRRLALDKALPGFSGALGESLTQDAN